MPTCIASRHAIVAILLQAQASNAKGTAFVKAVSDTINPVKQSPEFGLQAGGYDQRQCPTMIQADVYASNYNLSSIRWQTWELAMATQVVAETNAAANDFYATSIEKIRTLRLSA
jgi:hypothetical protein